MLRLKNISKIYKVADIEVNALKNVSLSFRKSEFVSILGPSGCGKTTMLNIIGGLDRYTSGDLIIEGKSTKEFKDRDWDTYRNSRIGFVFQSYNLIPHQTILGNVELALQIAGLSKQEREQKAKKAIDKVGLAGLYNKKPNQLSGGQCQRVAIARALVNDPEILLADEPTGALDTTTSIQIMDLIQEIAKEKLVIMVTHNPELADKYSTRIIRLLDGEIQSDTMPFSEADEIIECNRLFGRAVDSAKNLTASTDNGGSSDTIVDTTQENVSTLDKINVATIDTDSNALNETATESNLTINTATDSDVASDTIVDSGINNTATTNKADKKSADRKNKQQKVGVLTSLKDKFGKKAKVHTDKPNKKRVKMSFWTAFKLSAKNLFSKKGRTTMVSIAGSIGIIGISLVLSISVGVQAYIKNMQNDMLSGNPIEISESTFDFSAMMNSMPNNKKEEFIREAGYINIQKMIKMLIERADTMDSILVQNELTSQYIDFIKNMPKENYASILYDFGLDIANNIYTDYKENSEAVAEGISLTAIKSKFDSLLLANGEFEKYAYYLTDIGDTFRQAPTDDKYILSQYNLQYGKVAKEKNEIMVVLQKDSILNDVLLAQLGYYTTEEYLNMVYKAKGDSRYNASLDKSKLKYEDIVGKTFTWYPNNSIFTKNEGNKIIPFTYNAYSKDIEDKTDGIELTITGILEPKDNVLYGSMSSRFYYTEALTKAIIEKNIHSEIVQYLIDNGDENFTSTIKRKFNSTTNVYDVSVASGIVFDYNYTKDGKGEPIVTKGAIGKSNLFPNKDNNDVKTEMHTLTKRNLGGSTLPGTIKIYNVSFEQKDKVLGYLDKWNSDETIVVGGVEIPATDRKEVKYVDNLSIVIEMVNSFIEIITYALVAFTSLSLVVSSVMIGIITYISVVERIKEIGVIRSLGGRKRDVSNLFISETFIIGSSSGLIGIIITYILSAIINLIVSSLLDIAKIAIFPWYIALIMLTVSIVLTLISGLIPAKSAAKKDPVVALRAE